MKSSKERHAEQCARALQYHAKYLKETSPGLRAQFRRSRDLAGAVRAPLAPGHGVRPRHVRPAPGPVMGAPVDERVRKAKAYGKARGFHGKPGGWIYNGAGRPVCQGWLGLYFKFRRAIEEGTPA